MNVLLIDDDRFSLKALKQILQQEGHKVHPASNKLNALKKMKEEQVDCIVSDVHMPDTNIGELFEALKSCSNNPPPIIFICSEVNNPDIDAILLKGADAFIPKPVKPELLLRVINKLTAAQLS